MARNFRPNQTHEARETREDQLDGRCRVEGGDWVTVWIGSVEEVGYVCVRTYVDLSTAIE